MESASLLRFVPGTALFVEAALGAYLRSSVGVVKVRRAAAGSECGRGVALWLPTDGMHNSVRAGDRRGLELGEVPGTCW